VGEANLPNSSHGIFKQYNKSVKEKDEKKQGYG
jgi:hypothetical protein